MAEPLKNMYHPEFFERLCPVLCRCIPGFDCPQFIRLIFNNEWPDLELKARVRHIAKSLHQFLPTDFPSAKKILLEITSELQTTERSQSFALIFLADYIELYGVEYPDESLDAMEVVTQLVSCEFAIRPYLIRYDDKVFKVLNEWAQHPNEHVRRLASEGCRPRLPWAMGVPVLKSDPTRIITILETLKGDPSEYVRRSVANNLNDIAKDHPELVLKLIAKWKTKDPNVAWVIKHGCRTLLKKGNANALQFHGYDPKSKSSVKQLQLNKSKVKIGDYLHFDFRFLNRETKSAPFRLEYAIDYLTSTGKRSRKIFKITESRFEPGRPVAIQRKQSFKDFTTRKHFKGKHQLTIIANGKKLASKEFVIC